jgi:hypothetical protein
MIFQVTWKILPGLRGLGCSEFAAAATQSPDNERGVAVELASDAERETLIRQLEEQFATQWFSNNAAAFEAVKAYVLEWMGKRM